MKNRILILACVVLITGHLVGQVQEDLQWLIRDGKGKDGVELANSKYNNYSFSFSSTNFQIKGIFPAVPGIGLSGNPINKENEYFTIFENGDYSFISENGGAPIFETSVSINYLYLTNKYEEDDLPKNVKFITNSSSGRDLYDNLNLNRNYSHDILAEKDITFIFKQFNENRKLCYNIPLPTSLSFKKSGFKSNDPNNVLIFNGTLKTYLQKEFDSNNCIDIPASTGNVFLNFRPEYNPDDVGKSIEFNLYEETGGFIKTLDPINISGKFHDPNFVELKCIWEENGKKYAKYHIECYNDGVMPIKKLKMALILPNLAKSNKISITDWNAGGNPGCGIGKYFKKTLVGPILNVEFKAQNVNVLSGLSSSGIIEEGQIAWFEFCVELKPQTNIYTSHLQPTFPSTTFSNDNSSGASEIHYSIDTYIDKTHCEINSKLPPLGVDPISENCTFIRSNTKKCGLCKCTPK